MAHDLIQIIDIEKELKRLWDEKKHDNKIKACLFTLIVYSTESIRGDYIREITRSVTREYPCRMISIHERLSKDKCFTIEVSQHTSLEGGVLIASDQISITASSDFIERVPYVVIPEIVPDLPVYVIWGADVAKQSAVLKELEKYATKIIFDAESSLNRTAFAKTLYEKIGNVTYEFQDIHWALSAGWRECLYQALSKEEGILFLNSLTHIKITFNDIRALSIPVPDTLAWYIQAWLAARLDWKMSSIDKRTITYETPLKKLLVELVPDISKQFVSGTILSIEMKNSSGDTYAFIRHPDHDKIVLHVTRRDTCELPALYPFPDFQKGFNYIRELFFFVESDHYAKTLKCLSQG